MAGLNIQVLWVNIQAPKMISLELASQTTFKMNTAKCFPSKASFLLVFLVKKSKLNRFLCVCLFVHSRYLLNI